MSSAAYSRFVASTRLDYDKWHDGVPYDMDAFAQMHPQERAEVAAGMRRKESLDWRDMQVLAAEGTRESIDRLRDCLAPGHNDGPTRAWAIGCLIDAGWMSGSVPDVQISHLLQDLRDDEMLTPALMLAAAHAGPLTKLALLAGTRDRPGVALHFANTLLELHGIVDSAYASPWRPVLLALMHGSPAERNQAFAKVCEAIGLDPASLPAGTIPIDHQAAERLFPIKAHTS